MSDPMPVIENRHKKELFAWVSLAKALAADPKVPPDWRIKFAEVAEQLAEGIFDVKAVPCASREMVEIALYHR